MAMLLRHSFPFFSSSCRFAASSCRRRYRLLQTLRPKSHLSSGADAAAGNLNRKLEFEIFNTMKKQKEVFRPKVPGKVGMYVCGITAYDLSHIGHARVYVSFDVLYRYLKFLGYDVLYVRNFTDVDDKIITRANELREDPLSLSRRYCDEFLSDMHYLQCLPPSVEPRVSDHMPQIIDMIRQIIDNGCAYVVEGDVYFSVDKFPAYGRLSGRRLEDNRAGERVAVDSRKRNPADFALWKTAKPDEPSWDSPWGAGRPGWHIECSAMSAAYLGPTFDIHGGGMDLVFTRLYLELGQTAKPGEPSWYSPWGAGRPGWHIECSAMSAAYLGPTFDIHGGGMDLVFPHHENEIAQSCAACTHSHISYWVHNGFVTVDSEKMSKSLGNFFTIRQVIELYHPLVLRLFLMSTHYRSPINYSDAQLESASDRLFYIYQTLYDCGELLGQQPQDSGQLTVPDDISNCISTFQAEFKTSMSDDMHTPVVLAAMSEPLKAINDLLHTRKGKKQHLRIKSLAALEKEIRRVLVVLGLMPSDYVEVLQQLREKALTRAGLTEDQVLHKIQERTVARKNKEYEKSDCIRKDLAAVGIALMDGSDGTIWRPSVPVPAQEQIDRTS